MQAYPGYDAARTRAAVADQAGRGLVAVAGIDRRGFLHALLTNDVAGLAVGSGCYAALLTPQGRMVTDMRVLELGDLTLLDLPAAVTPDVLQRLDGFVFSEDVRLGDLTEAFAGLSVVGPNAARVVHEVLASSGSDPAATPTPEELQRWPEYRNARLSYRGEPVVVVASSDLGVPGFDLVVERPHVPALAAAIASSGAERLGAEAVEVLRVEAGRPLFGVDMDRETIPLEAGIEGRAISFTKGCYPGQEVVIRIVHRGHGRVARRLVGLVVEGGVVPAPGDALRAGDQEAGRVTSAVWSPLVGGPIAIAFLARHVSEPGSQVSVCSADRLLPARVVALPFAPTTFPNG